MFRPAGDDFEDDSDDEFMFGNELPYEEYKDPSLSQNRQPNASNQPNPPVSGYPASPGGMSIGFGRPQFNQTSSNKKQPKRQAVHNMGGPSLEDFRTAAIKGNVETVTSLVKQGIAVDSVLKSDWTCLMYSANCANYQMVQELLNLGANPNFDKDGYTVLMAACGASLRSADDIIKCVDLLLQKGANPHVHDKYHMTALMYASRMGYEGVVQKFLGSDVDLNKQDSHGFTALTWAANRGHFSVGKCLVESGCDLDKLTVHGQSAVDVALSEDHIKVVEFLESKSGKRQQSIVVCNPAEGAVVTNGHVTEETQSKIPKAAVPSQKQTFVKFGQLELFLSGLNLTNLIPTFSEHQIEFADFLRMNDSDLEKLGIKQVGIRKKILDAIHDVHKKDWEPSSVATVQYNKQLTCPEAVAMVANIEKHVIYISSSIGYIQDQIRMSPKLLQTGQNGSGVDQLSNYTEESIKAAQKLHNHLSSFKKQLSQYSHYKPADIIATTSDNRCSMFTQKTNSKRRILILLAAMTTVGLCLWKKDEILSIKAGCRSYFDQLFDSCF